MKRSYKQNCALAHALDLVGERWTLLIVRELLAGRRRYGELLENLPGMGTNLLASRLKDLAAMDFIAHDDGQYHLTESGMALEEVVHALIRFALPLGIPPQPGGLHRPEWDAVALAALYRAEWDSGLSGRYLIELDGNGFAIEIDAGHATVSSDTKGSFVTQISLGKETARLLSGGELQWGEAMSTGKVVVAGKKSQAAKLLRAFGLMSR